MSWFRRKEKKTGKGADRDVPLNKAFKTLNYTPQEYYYLSEYLDFLNNSERYLGRIVKNMVVDDVSTRYQVDNLIDGITARMTCYIDEQYTNHMNVIYDLDNIYQGELAGAKHYLEYLRKDLKEYDMEIKKWKDLQESLGIR